MNIVYISTAHKWKERGVTRGLYEALKNLGHRVIYLKELDMDVCTDNDVDEVWGMFSGRIFTDAQASQIKARKVGFNLTQKHGLIYRRHYDIMYSSTIDENTEFFIPSIDPTFHRNYYSDRTIKYGFFGKIRGHRIQMLSDHPEIVAFDITKHGIKLIQSLNSVQVGIDLESKKLAHTIPHRIMEYAACGCMVCCLYREDIARIFEYGKDIVEYKGRLPEYNAEIAESGYRVAQQQTYSRRVKEILNG